MNKYIAFISYRHKKEDTETARLLRKGIENAHLPKWLKSDGRRRVFRDTDELPTSSDLSRDIENALDDSDYLIAVCSEDYIKSKWCLKEVDMYIASGRKDRILPVLLSGTPETSIPESIRDLPLASDLRDDLEKGGSLRKAVDYDLPGILSRMLDAPEETIRRSERRFRIQAALAVFSVIFLILTGFGIYAIHTANRINDLNEQIAQATVQAQEAQALALEERNAALLKKAQFLSKQAWVAIDEGRFDDAIRLGLEALPEDLNGDEPVSDEALAVLRTALAMSIRLPYVKTAEFDLPVNIQTVLETPENRAVIETDDGELYYLSYEDGSLKPYEGVYNWISLYDYRNDILSEMKNEGYTGYYFTSIAYPEMFVFYGDDFPLISRSKYPEYEFTYTVNGEPFYATGIQTLNYLMVAWKEYEDDEKPCAALFDMRYPEAIAVFPVHTPVSVAFGDSSDCHSIFITDETGTIYSFDREYGQLLTSSDGDYTNIMFMYNNAPKILGIKGDGTGAVLNTINLEPVYEITAPTYVRTLLQCSNRNMILSHCDDGVRLYSRNTGDFLMDVVMEDGIIAASWEGYPLSDGHRILVFYKDKLEIYQPGRDDEKTGTSSIPLCDDSLVTTQSRPFYSNDGKSVYLYHAGYISKWDTETGELLWVHEPDGTFIGNYFDSILSDDGSYIWSPLSLKNGVYKIDTETGENVFSCSYPRSFYIAPLDSPDGNMSLIISSDELIMIDSQNGDIIWEKEIAGMVSTDPGKPVFSIDSNEIYCLRTHADPESEEYIKVYELEAFGSDSGVEIRTLRIDQTENFYFIPEIDLAMYIRSIENSSGDISYELVRIELSTFKELGTVIFPYSNKPYLVRPDTGLMTLVWNDADDNPTEKEMCCSFDREGNIGEPVEVESADGRRMVIDADKLIQIYGFDAYITSGSIRRLSDDLILFGSTGDALDGLSGNGMNFVVSPDGSSVCISGTGMTEEVTPFLIYSLSNEELVANARERLGRIGG